jgi:hypothetical protein
MLLNQKRANFVGFSMVFVGPQEKRKLPTAVFLQLVVNYLELAKQ